MNKIFSKFALLVALAGGSASAWALDGTVIANESVPETALDAAALKAIYTAKTTYWNGGQAVVIIVAGDKTDAAIEQASGMNPSSFKTFWQRLAFSGRGQQPKRTNDGASAVTAVAATKGAIAIVPSDTDVKGVKTLTVN